METTQGDAPSVRLSFRKGDLIFKQGDFGISIYKILQGKVSLFSESGGKETPLATLGTGEVIGEMAFLSRTEPRDLSAKAVEDSELEVWHPAMLSKEYEQMPPMLKYIADQVLRRLLRMNVICGKLSEEHEKVRSASQGEMADLSQRLFYRKEMENPCTYRPSGSSRKVNLSGKIKDLSFRGLGLEVSVRNLTHFSHEKEDEFQVETVLPNGKEIEFTAKIVYINKNVAPGRLFLGMELQDISHDSRKALGFFLMP